jgi:hypothetical protein
VSKGIYSILFLFSCCLGNAQLIKSKEASKEKAYPLTLVFQNRVDSQLLSLDSTYTNPQGETFQVRNFRYYIANIMVEDDGPIAHKYSLANPYFLIDERKPESKSITIQVPFQNISSLRFSIGVDSALNVSGVQTGALDPANGMFWTWNSGYIFAKLEGTSPQSKASQHGFTYHIGGFRTGENAIRQVMLSVGKTLTPNKPTTITIAANVNAWFGTGVTVAGLPSVMQPGPPAMQIADNYSRMFGVVP